MRTGLMGILITFGLVACSTGSAPGVVGGNMPPVVQEARTYEGETTPSVHVTSSKPQQPAGYSAEQRQAFNAINTARLQCGFGALSQNSMLDASVARHLEWMAASHSDSHFESAGPSGYSGANPWDRMKAAGYDWLTAGEVMDEMPGHPRNFGTEAIRILLGAPYHLRSLMRGHSEMGIGIRDLKASNGNDAFLLVDMGSRKGLPRQSQAANVVLTYPCEGVSGTIWKVIGEDPNPLPARNLATQPIGQSILVQTASGNVLQIRSASVAGPRGSLTLLPVLSGFNDPNKLLTKNQAIILSAEPMSPNTTYRVTISGTNAGEPFSTSFSFSTGP